MFGLVIPGRLVDTTYEAVDDDKVVFNIVEPQSVKHIVVFLTGETPLEEGMGAGIYICWPTHEPSWQYVGFICNEKPSALFRLSDVQMPEGEVSVAQIGLSSEPLAELAQAAPTPQAKALTQSDLVTFTNFTVESLFNFVTSFSCTPEEAATKEQDDWFPIGCLHKWFETFKNKLEHDPVFWRRAFKED
eukprot:m.142030 g.142030  ORF g.142030 m.142030 type:complete len:189 (+) comp14047_c0_seq5:208-774(+)